MKHETKLQVGEEEVVQTKKEFDAKLSHAINTALEVILAWELYTHRVASPEQFLERLKDLSEFYISNLKNNNDEVQK